MQAPIEPTRGAIAEATAWTRQTVTETNQLTERTHRIRAWKTRSGQIRPIVMSLFHEHYLARHRERVLDECERNTKHGGQHAHQPESLRDMRL